MFFHSPPSQLWVSLHLSLFYEHHTHQPPPYSYPFCLKAWYKGTKIDRSYSARHFDLLKGTKASWRNGWFSNGYSREYTKWASCSVRKYRSAQKPKWWSYAEGMWGPTCKSLQGTKLEQSEKQIILPYRRVLNDLYRFPPSKKWSLIFPSTCWVWAGLSDFLSKSMESGESNFKRGNLAITTMASRSRPSYDIMRMTF